jgi:serine/threonine protein kinase/dipeptidyl aminopeptidase/acylaminoacyl peptidase
MGSPLPSGTKLDRYEIISLLGAGGMGEVYLAEDTRLHRRVALKILPVEVASHRDRMRRFTQEATAAASLNHPNIAHIYETGEAEAKPPAGSDERQDRVRREAGSSEGQGRVNREAGSSERQASVGREVLHFIAMEFVDGITLREKIHREHSDLRKLLRYLQQVAEGLAKAHAAGVVHRDLKPDNIMITRDGHAKILDFGLVKLIEPALPPRTGDQGSSEVATAVMPQHSTPGTVLGTVGYMSPEQAQGKTTEIDHRSDIFSFGCILFEAVTGHKPFEGESVIKSLHMVVYEPAPPIKDFNPSAPAELQRIIRRCLAKDPEERHQSIKDVAIELKEVRHEMTDTAGVDTTVPPSLSGSSGASASPLSTQSDPLTAATVTGSPNAKPTQSSAEYLVGGIKQHRKAVAIALALLLVVGTVAAVGWYKFAGKAKVEPFTSIKFTRLTNGGRVGNAVMDGSTSISPDGRYVVFSLNDAGKISLWVRQISTNSNVQIVPPADGGNGGTTISRDGEFVYYRWIDENDPEGSIYQVPILGGTPRKILSGAESPVSFSPDGQRFAFMRSLPGQGDSLMVANADGSGERTLVTRSGNDWFNGGGPSWSPDGKTIACATGSDTGGSHMTVIGVEPNTGVIRPLTTQKWLGDIHRVVWMGDSSGLIALAETEFQSTGGIQLWFISYPDGVARRITNDLNSYGRVSLGLAADNSTIVTAQTDPSMQIWTIGLNEPVSRAKQITNGKVDGVDGLTWTPDGRIVYVTKAGDKSELWIMNADGSDNKQLTSDGYFKNAPAVSPDGRFIFFASMRSGIPHIWRINRDGSNPKQITSGDFADFEATCAPDGQWITFVSFRTGRPFLWKVGVDGGEAVQLTDKPSERALFSPDGTSLACGYFVEGATSPWKIAIMPIAGGQPSKLIDVPRRGLGGWSWAPDGRAIIYSATQNDVTNLWSQPLDGGKPSQITDFTTERIPELSIAPDGKLIALSRGHSTLDVVLIKDSK